MVQTPGPHHIHSCKHLLISTVLAILSTQNVRIKSSRRLVTVASSQKVIATEVLSLAFSQSLFAQNSAMALELITDNFGDAQQICAYRPPQLLRLSLRIGLLLCTNRTRTLQMLMVQTLRPSALFDKVFLKVKMVVQRHLFYKIFV